MKKIIDIQNLTKSFKDSHALNDLSLEHSLRLFTYSHAKNIDMNASITCLVLIVNCAVLIPLKKV